MFLRRKAVITKSIAKINAIYAEFPPKFWVLVAASFVDRVGGTLIFPFFTLYITDKFDVGMTQAGMLLGTFHLTGLLGNMIGGALADRFGRKSIVIFGLAFSALSALSMGFVNRLEIFYVLAMIVGLLSDMAGPAWQAMIADILPENKRTEGFGVLRVVGNMAWIVGPSIKGLTPYVSKASGFKATWTSLVSNPVKTTLSICGKASNSSLSCRVKPNKASGSASVVTAKVKTGTSSKSKRITLGSVAFPGRSLTPSTAD